MQTQKSFFNTVALAPPDPIFGLVSAFQCDPRKEKVDLMVGIYRDEEGRTPIFSSVKKAEQRLLEREVTKMYLPIDGDPFYLEKMQQLVLGEAYVDRICATQTVGGTSALRVGAEFIKGQLTDEIHIPQLTWPNHKGVFLQSGMRLIEYPYYNHKTHTVEFDQLYSFLKGLREKSVVLFHAACHNPTGADLKIDQWELLADLFLKKRLIPFFDSAYQGLGEGLDADAGAIRLFFKRGIEMLVAVSFSKNFGLYGERIGGLMIASCTSSNLPAIRSQICRLIRTNYSNPPQHGARIVAEILSSDLRQEWEKEVEVMRMRMCQTRILFARKVNMAFLAEGKGIFCYLGLSPEKIESWVKNNAVYLAHGGRMNIAGLNEKNIDLVVKAFQSQ